MSAIRKRFARRYAARSDGEVSSFTRKSCYSPKAHGQPGKDTGVME
nr:hypothetical protein [Marinobacterium profundum]